MSVIQVGLVDNTRKLDPHFVQEVAAAINIQVMRDLPQYWNIAATVRALSDPKQIPPSVWPVFLVPKLPPGEGGVHLDRNNQPYSLVIAHRDSADWTLDASHEIIEMLVDPAGNRMHTSRAIEVKGKRVVDTAGEYGYLVEACDPCEDAKYGYTISGVTVSDFITPHFYDPMAVAGTRYSFTGALTRPRQVLPGGYISFTNPRSDRWEQILWLGSTPQVRDLGPAEGGCLRAFIDNKTNALVANRRKPNKSLANCARAHRSRIDAMSAARGAYYATKSCG